MSLGVWVFIPQIGIAVGGNSRNWGDPSIDLNKSLYSLL